MVKVIDERITEIDKEIENIMSQECRDEAKMYVLKRERHDLIKMCKIMHTKSPNVRNNYESDYSGM